MCGGKGSPGPGVFGRFVSEKLFDPVRGPLEVRSHKHGNRDYLTIPEDDIGNVRVLMTAVGGETIHLVPSLANEFGMEATGAQVTHGGAAANW